MNKVTLGTAALTAIFGGMVVAASVGAQQQSTPVPWSGCCGFNPWPTMGPGMMGRGMMGGGMMAGGDTAACRECASP